MSAWWRNLIVTYYTETDYNYLGRHERLTEVNRDVYKEIKQSF